MIIAGSGFIHVIRGKEGDSGVSSCLSILGYIVNQIPIKVYFQSNPLARICNNEHVQHITCIYIMQDRANKKLITYVNYWKSVDL